MADWVEPGRQKPPISRCPPTMAAGQAFGPQRPTRRAVFLPQGRYSRVHERGLCLSRSKSGVAKLGVSIRRHADDVESHGKFRDKYELNFPLLADVDHHVAEKYGAWREKNLYGKKSMGIQRSTYLIDPQGKIGKVWKTRQRRRARRRSNRGDQRPRG